MDQTNGASNNERLLAAARQDNEDLLLEILKLNPDDYDINCQDGLGNTPLHNAILGGSIDVLEHILTHEDCDVDPVNFIEKETPLHLAVRTENVDLRMHLCESLLDAGADIYMKDKNNRTILDVIPLQDTELHELIRKYQAQVSVSKDDVASDGENGSGYESD